jgi:hypothetical protein
MRRRLALLLTATSLTLFGGVAIAAPAFADRDAPNARSLHGQCVSAAAGLHVGWGDHENQERRNLGGTCEGQ